MKLPDKDTADLSFYVLLVLALIWSAVAEVRVESLCSRVVSLEQRKTTVNVALYQQ